MKHQNSEIPAVLTELGGCVEALDLEQEMQPRPQALLHSQQLIVDLGPTNC